jgi:hypothetical protein
LKPSGPTVVSKTKFFIEMSYRNSILNSYLKQTNKKFVFSKMEDKVGKAGPTWGLVTVGGCVKMEKLDV